MFCFFIYDPCVLISLQDPILSTFLNFSSSTSHPFNSILVTATNIQLFCTTMELSLSTPPPTLHQTLGTCTQTNLFVCLLLLVMITEADRNPEENLSWIFHVCTLKCLWLLVSQSSGTGSVIGKMHKARPRTQVTLFLLQEQTGRSAPKSSIQPASSSVTRRQTRSQPNPSSNKRTLLLLGLCGPSVECLLFSVCLGRKGIKTS